MVSEHGVADLAASAEQAGNVSRIWHCLQRSLCSPWRCLPEQLHPIGINGRSLRGRHQRAASGGCHVKMEKPGKSGRGAAWLARLLGVQEVPGSNPGGPTKRFKELQPLA